MLKITITLTLTLIFSITIFSQVAAPVKWKKQEHNFGIVEEGIAQTVKFEFENVGDKPIIVDNVRTICRCIIPYWDNQVIKPNEKGVIRITFETQKGGRFNKATTVTFRNYSRSELLTIQATTESTEYGLTVLKSDSLEKADMPSNANDDTPVSPNYRKKTKASGNTPGNPNRKRSKKEEDEERNAPIKYLPNRHENPEVQRKRSIQYPFMTSREEEMIEEINLLRANPAAYASFIKEYIQMMNADIKSDLSMEDIYREEIAAAYELIDVLESTRSLSLLKPHQSVYLAASKHGKYMVSTGNFEHVGVGNTYPWDRILKAAPNMSDANENLVAGPYEVRHLVVLLLVDSSTPNRGHRRTLLNPSWNFIACKEVGQIGNMPNCWIQDFAKK